MTTQTSCAIPAVDGRSLFVSDVHGGPQVAEMLATAKALQAQAQAERHTKLVEMVETRNRTVGSYS